MIQAYLVAFATWLTWTQRFQSERPYTYVHIRALSRARFSLGNFSEKF